MANDQRILKIVVLFLHAFFPDKKKKSFLKVSSKFMPHHVPQQTVRGREIKNIVTVAMFICPDNIQAENE